MGGRGGNYGGMNEGTAAQVLSAEETGLAGMWGVQVINMLRVPGVPFDSALKLLILGLWIFMLVKTTKGKKHSLPVFGELAERSL